MPLSAVRLLLPLWLLVAAPGHPARAQTRTTDSLRQLVARTPPDTSRVLLLLKLAYTYRASRPDSTVRQVQRALRLARQLGFGKGEGRALNMAGASLRERGELPKAFAHQLEALRLARAHHDPEGEAISLNGLGNICFDLRQYRQAINHYKESKGVFERLNLTHWVAGALTNIGSCYEKMDVLDSALVLQRQAEFFITRFRKPRLAEALALRNMGTLQARLGHYPAALDYYRRALHETYRNNDLRNRAMAQYRMAVLFNTLHQPDSSMAYARQALRNAQRVSYRLTVLDAGNLLASLYQVRHRPDSALRYQGLAIAAHDSLFGPDKFRQVQLLALSEQQRQLQQRAEQELQAGRYQRMGLLTAGGFLLLIAVVLGRANRQQRRANQLLNERNAQIEAQRNDLSLALAELHTAQAQLVAAEKWAFVGELSAGIAHELQNPLAFMQNFADVSMALLDGEAGRGATGRPPAGLGRATGLQQEILAGLKQNLREISQHGQRASSIIKGMLEHSRAGAGHRTPTDLNALVTENLRLAQHTAPTGTPVVELVCDLAPDLGPVLVAAPELGRTLLNLFGNALHAVNQRRQAAPAGYQPQVRVTTRRLGPAEVEIRVRDNGTGMAAGVAGRVFEPFFTTKPNGEGTGLGLSLAHDIIVKGHHGTLTVETREGEFTEFTVRLPA